METAMAVAETKHGSPTEHVASDTDTSRQLEHSSEKHNGTVTATATPIPTEIPVEEPASRPARKPASFMLAFAGLSILILVIHVDATCLGIALPTIARDLGGTNLESFWASMAYTLTSLAVHPLAAPVSEVAGRAPPLYASVGLFLAGSVVFARAGSMGTLVAGRALQGLGGGGLDVMVSVAVADATTLGERATWLGVMAVPSAAGNVAGPFVGALLSSRATWRWIGWINLPILGVGFPLVFFFLEWRPVASLGDESSRLGRVDWVGMVLVVVGITALVTPLSWAGSLFPWASWQTLVPMMGGVALLAVFVAYEAHPPAPIMPHRLFRSRTGNATQLGGFLHGAVLMSLLQYLPLLYQAAALETALGAAVALLPTVVVSTFATAASMMLVPALGGYVWLLRAAWGMLVAGTGLLVLVDAGSSRAARMGAPVLWGVGASLLRLNMLPMQASVARAGDEGLATGQLLTVRMLGGLMGLTLSSALFNTVFASRWETVRASMAMMRMRASEAEELAPLGEASNAVGFIGELATLDAEVLGPVLGAYLASFRAILYAMAGVGALGLATCFLVDEIDLDTDSDTRMDRGTGGRDGGRE